MYALIVLIIQMGFTSYFGSIPSHQPTSVDQWLARTYPRLYNNLDVLGLRSAAVCEVVKQVDMNLVDPEIQKDLKWKAQLRIIAIVAFFLISIYLALYFEK